MKVQRRKYIICATAILGVVVCVAAFRSVRRYLELHRDQSALTLVSRGLTAFQKEKGRFPLIANDSGKDQKSTWRVDILTHIPNYMDSSTTLRDEIARASAYLDRPDAVTVPFPLPIFCNNNDGRLTAAIPVIVDLQSPWLHTSGDESLMDLARSIGNQVVVVWMDEARVPWGDDGAVFVCDNAKAVSIPKLDLRLVENGLALRIDGRIHFIPPGLNDHELCQWMRHDIDGTVYRGD